MRITKKKVIEELSSLSPIPKREHNKFVSRFKKMDNLITRKRETLNDKASYLYHCTCCDNSFTSKKIIKINTSVKCPKCGFESRLKNNNFKVENNYYYYLTVEVNERKELVERVFCYVKRYNRDKLNYDTIFDDELFRINVIKGIVLKGRIKADVFSHILKPDIFNSEVKWREDRTDWLSCYNSIVEDGLWDNVKKIESFEPFKYSQVSKMVKNGLMGKVNLSCYLRRFLIEPKLEFLAKCNAWNLISDISNSGEHDFIEYVMRMDKSDFKFIKENKNCDFSDFKIHKEFRIDDLTLIRKAKAVSYLNFKEKCSLTRHVKNINYLYENNIDSNDYNDYIKWVIELNEDLSFSRIRYPKDFMKAHDNYSELYLMKINEKKEKRIKELADELSDFVYENEIYLIRPTENSGELLKESNALNHCVKTYADRVADKKTSIFFVRCKETPFTPFVTIELDYKNRRMIQCRALKNSVPADDVKIFVNDWCRKNKIISCFN